VQQCDVSGSLAAAKRRWRQCEARRRCTVQRQQHGGSGVDAADLAAAQQRNVGNSMAAAQRRRQLLEINHLSSADSELAASTLTQILSNGVLALDNANTNKSL
jgi:hypothetical protein